jgi:hypothetical protein
VGFLDKAKLWLGIVDAGEVEEEDDAPRAALRIDPRRERKQGERPPLDGLSAAPTESIEDALAAREAGDVAEMRRLLREMDRGRGLRLVLRAAAALEAGDERELGELLPRVREEEPRWRLSLQLAAALDQADRAGALRAGALRAEAERDGAPGWALAWAQALSRDDEAARRGLVELLFLDPALARTVAARDLSIAGAEADPTAAKRYTAFAHGRDCLRRFGAALVVELLERTGK